MVQSLLALILGRVVLGLTIMAISPVGFFDQMIRVIKLGWPGILIQLAVVPVLVDLIDKRLRK